MENHVKDLLDRTNQTSISNLLWEIRNIRMISGKVCSVLCQVVLWCYVSYFMVYSPRNLTV